MTEVDIVRLIERARSVRSMMGQMLHFFNTSFSSLDKAQENTTRLLKEFEEQNKFKDELLAQQERTMAHELSSLKDEIRLLREAAGEKDAERQKLKDKKKSRVKRPFKNSLSF